MESNVFSIGDQVLIPIEWDPEYDFGMTAGVVLEVRVQTRGIARARNYSYVVELLMVSMTIHVAEEDCVDGEVISPEFFESMESAW